MKVAELYEVRKFRLVERPVADPGPGEVQVRVEAVGICGSDMHYFAEGRIGDVVCKYPVVVGHEPTGVVVKAGPGVTGWNAGDRVALEPAIYCYHCEFCLSGRHNICANIRFLSSPPEPGFFCEYVNLPAASLLPLPEDLGFGEGTLFEPLAVVLHSMKFAALRPRDTAAVFGAGPIGLMTVAVLKMCGAGRIWAVEPVAHRREMAKQIGADVVIDPEETDPGRAILSDTGRRGVDVVIDCAAHGGSVNHSIQAARNGGRVVITGIPSEAQVAIDFHVARRKELAILNVRRSNHDSEAALDLLRENRGKFAPLITHTFPLSGVQEAFEMLEHYSGGACKVIIEPR